jgi:hypothetical protein
LSLRRINMSRKRSLQIFTLLVVGVLVACTPRSSTLPDRDPGGRRPEQPATPSPQPTEDLFLQLNQLIPFDGIPPIYDPTFSTAEDAPYREEELVIGTVIGDEAKAYSITVLRNREMVNDELGGIPILVTW